METDNRTDTVARVSLATAPHPQQSHNGALKKINTYTGQTKGDAAGFDNFKQTAKCSLTSFQEMALLQQITEIFILSWKRSAAFKCQMTENTIWIVKCVTTIARTCRDSNTGSNCVMTVSLHSGILLGIVIIADRWNRDAGISYTIQQESVLCKHSICTYICADPTTSRATAFQCSTFKLIRFFFAFVGMWKGVGGVCI